MNAEIRTRVARASRRPRVGFLGLGWIGRNRFEALQRSGLIEVAGIADPDEGALATAAEKAPQARRGRTLDDLLAMDLDAVVIATPSAAHAEHAAAALRHGMAVFCQKPLGRTAEETADVVEAA